MFSHVSRFGLISIDFYDSIDLIFLGIYSVLDHLLTGWPSVSRELAMVVALKQQWSWKEANSTSS